MSRDSTWSRRSRGFSPAPLPNQLPGPEDLALSEGPISEDAAELLHEFVHPHRHAQDALVDEPPVEEDEELRRRATLPWWKRPSPIWLLILIPFTTIASSACMAPRIEVFTLLVCSTHKPDIYDEMFPKTALSVLAALAGNQGKASPCAADPTVNAEVAKLNAAMSTSLGILSCLTSAWWGALSDRTGRTQVMGICVLGLLVTDVVLILVVYLNQYLPGGYWFLISGSIIEGSLGGLTSAIAVTHTYVSDTSTPDTRSRVLSLNLGLLFLGISIGPTFGSMVNNLSGTIMAVFFCATAVHTLYAFVVWFLLPEPLTKMMMMRARSKYQQDKAKLAADREMSASVGFLIRLKRVFSFLSPLTVFAPLKVHDGNPLKAHKRDWSLTLVAVAYGFTISIMGAYNSKFQYAQYQFGWTSETIGYWLSLVAITRAIFLTLVLPVVIRLFKPKPPQESHDTQPLLPGQSATSLPSARHHHLTFDLALTRISILIELVAYTCLSLLINPVAFTVFGMLGAFGSGFGPGLQSVALELFSRRGGIESGKLFGALAVVQALTSQIIGPSLYGLIYMKTVATLPRAIFFVSVASLAISTVLLGFIRVPKNVPRIVVSDDDLEEQDTRNRDSSLVTDG